MTNIKCFEALEYTFDHEDGASLVIAGDNGDGKSTILRSIAISLCDQWTAAGLLRELFGEFIRSDDDIDEGVITLELKNSDSRYSIETTIRWNEDYSYEYPERKIFKKTNKKRSKIHDESFPWSDVFATGYGAGLRTSGTQDFQYYFTGDSIYSLFRDDVSLQNPELAIRRITESISKNRKDGQEESEKVKAEILSWLDEILLLNGRNVVLKPNGLYIADRATKKRTPLAASGDGYKALTGLVLDMLAWWFLNRFYDAEEGKLRKDRKVTAQGLNQISGIVIIDELEQHLHPKWQQEILPALKKNFPKVQFIVATHSPLVISGAKTPILVLENCNGESREFFGWRAEDIYREMGVRRTSRPQEMMKRLRDFDALYKKKLDGSIVATEKRQLTRLQSQLLQDLPASDPAIETIKMMALAQNLDENAKRKKK